MGGLFSRSIGKKLLMSLAGLFLVTFLVVHLGINLLLVFFESTRPFNLAANFMMTNVVVKVFEVVLFAGFIIHIIYGLILSVQNMRARSVGYKKAPNSQTSFFSKYMFHTALIILAFLVIHLIDFYFKAKILEHEGAGKYIIHLENSKELFDLGALVLAKFQQPFYVIFYIASFLFLGFHLHHGFQSAFQTLGINHQKYTPFIKLVGVLYTLVIVAGFSIIPLFIYFFK